ncbi:MAG TPA: SRPBCC family protein [Candidatus Kapabacteria bacterium]|nr:SRPBCC family protein [Candidatus Kapabacteria bacterium]
MKVKTKNIIIKAPVEQVFAYMDNIGNTGMHMMKNSSMMMGSKLKLDQLSENATGPNATFRWYGKMLWFKMDFTVLVTKWIKDREKSWETIGSARMIILGWYRMQLILTPIENTTKAELSIQYIKPEGFFYKILSLLLSSYYASWCLSNMLNDSKHYFES